MTKTTKNSPVNIENHPIIFAWATPPGRAGVAVLRLSGTNIQSVMMALLGAQPPLAPRRAHLRQIMHPDSREIIDQALMLYFSAPHSFTGEDVLELHTHGSFAVRESLMNALSTLPHCRPAEPGEFTRRAFLNNKLDLVQAEGLADLIDAQTDNQRRQALRQLDGAMSDRLHALRGDVVRALALIEAYIDFPDEEIPESVVDDITRLVGQCRADIEALLQDHQTGEKIREGYVVAIIGPPNAGKSSLLNVLAKRDVAIVSDMAGTTRDSIEVELNLNGYLVRLIDTAGIRESTQPIEQEGIRRSLRHAASADLKLLVLDIVTNPELEPDMLSLIDDQTCVVLNKCDQSHGPASPQLSGYHPLHISTHTQTGLTELIARIEQFIQSRHTGDASPLITRSRHRAALTESLQHLSQFDMQQPIELVAEELRRAALAIGRVTGKVEVDQLLDVIFREFCIGK